MAFEGPAARDFNNVRSLNRALLELVAADDRAVPMPPGLSDRLSRLDRRAREKLAKTPVLLLSVCEDDVDRWTPVFESRQERDLFSTLDGPTLPLADLTSATLGFLWQLASCDAYAARVISGASIEWCEELAKTLLVDVLEFGRREPGLVSLRHAGSERFWKRLLKAATSDVEGVRKASRLAAMQAMLTGSAEPGVHRSLRAAACPMRRAMRVAESDTS